MRRSCAGSSPNWEQKRICISRSGESLNHSTNTVSLVLLKDKCKNPAPFRSPTCGWGFGWDELDKYAAAACSSRWKGRFGYTDVRERLDNQILKLQFFSHWFSSACRPVGTNLTNVLRGGCRFLPGPCSQSSTGLLQTRLQGFLWFTVSLTMAFFFF